jgi:hypothetical protein
MVAAVEEQEGEGHFVRYLHRKTFNFRATPYKNLQDYKAKTGAATPTLYTDLVKEYRRR